MLRQATKLDGRLRRSPSRRSALGAGAALGLDLHPVHHLEALEHRLVVELGRKRPGELGTSIRPTWSHTVERATLQARAIWRTVV